MGVAARSLPRLSSRHEARVNVSKSGQIDSVRCIREAIYTALQTRKNASVCDGRK
jgi:hypothetical protein